VGNDARRETRLIAHFAAGSQVSGIVRVKGWDDAYQKPLSGWLGGTPWDNRSRVDYEPKSLRQDAGSKKLHSAS